MEQNQIERAKREAKTKPRQWEQDTKEVDWKEMLRTCKKNKSIAERRHLMLDVYGTEDGETQIEENRMGGQ